MKIYRVEFKVSNESNHIKYFVSNSTAAIEEFEEKNKWWDIIEIRVISKSPIIDK